MNKISIIIPVFNEKNTILALLEKIEEADLGLEKEIIIVDDYSSDGTRELLKKVENKYKVLYHEKNYGKGRALRTGFAKATGDVIVVQDADLEYEPQDLAIMIKKMNETEALAVYGSRRLNRRYFESQYFGSVFTLGGFFLTWLANFLYSTKITDEPTCYKMFRASLLPKLDLKCDRFEFCPELTAKLAKMGVKIQEVPINYYPRQKNEGKKIRWRDGLEAIWTLLKYKFKK